MAVLATVSPKSKASASSRSSCTFPLASKMTMKVARSLLQLALQAERDQPTRFYLFSVL
jgi:hypothetical protein